MSMVMNMSIDDNQLIVENIQSVFAISDAVLYHIRESLITTSPIPVAVILCHFILTS